MQRPIKIARRTALMLPVGLLASCGLFDSKKKSIVPGVKIPVIATRNPLKIDPQAPPISLPAAAANQAWSQSARNALHATGNIALPEQLGEAWHSSIGAGATYRRVLHAAPIAANGQVFTMDANGFIDAFDASNGRRLWRKSMRPKHVTSFALGGGLGFADGTLFVATAFSELHALDPASGALRWQKSLGQPARSAPTIGGGSVYLVQLDNTLVAYDAKTGAFGWRFPAGESVNSVLGAGAPAYQHGIVVAGFGTGLIAGIHAETGTAIWEQSLAAGYDASNPLNIATILADPVISGNLVIVNSVSGSTVAFDLRSGRRIWSHSAGASSTPAAAGNWLFLLTDDQTLAAIDAIEGRVAWVTQLPAFRNEKSDSGPITWHGPLLAGTRLILAGDDSRLLTVDAMTGALLDQPAHALHLRGKADHAPIAVNGQLLTLTRNAVLTSYR
jgi:outer membrane protein assembly factor BamB